MEVLVMNNTFKIIDNRQTNSYGDRSIRRISCNILHCQGIKEKKLT